MTAASEKTTRRFTIDCTKPASDSLISPSDLGAFLQQKIKCYTGKKEKLLHINANGNIVEVDVTGGFIGKQGLKWQIGRFLHMKKLRAFIKIFAQGLDGFELRYINVEEGKEE
ncbi:60S RIBOSOMAL PROTEIN L22 [Encephalitozoon cuniculi GB-M1]|uniref:Large ribosomal subunit protein eL22 n=2 Tax=Encephalitozoon cuniculi TaxID=6035 RepID=RL22_ENCCU|nr:60S ribosomal protein L22 [Encephalitozoon cuniculi GB-M1]Q8SS49.1 RecName: Full=Large ribosomal subunit protein eL22; AltName: Full=60S ribosomal protein L22 [Encephalitozoon cuniculi GB-M1]7QEP_N2 Chain N2, 60S ribosomal protein L22 [Encephalitozoon cuniculi GB-M1]AGE95339.1 60S ribosomal protein l22 [Encephalitozoon cuniculi]KMV66277.1 60S ribosomal protein L22 [Encephalitozoon cuniculi EcunIII-L]UYI27453.1 ribosomal protein L22 [Encephalitozoon cuniculi]CAD25261.1 60S RIBOSOMAL PROTEIN